MSRTVESLNQIQIQKKNDEEDFVTLFEKVREQNIKLDTLEQRMGKFVQTENKLFERICFLEQIVRKLCPHKGDQSLHWDGHCSRKCPDCEKVIVRHTWGPVFNSYLVNSSSTGRVCKYCYKPQTVFDVE